MAVPLIKAPDLSLRSVKLLLLVLTVLAFMLCSSLYVVYVTDESSVVTILEIEKPPDHTTKPERAIVPKPDYEKFKQAIYDFEKDVRKVSDKIKCNFSYQDPFDPAIVNVFDSYPYVDCKNGTPSIVHMEGDVLKINKSKAKLRNITIDHCSYMTITLRNGTDYEVDKSNWSRPFALESKIDSGHENIVVNCYHGSKKVAASYLTRIVKKKSVEETSENNYRQHIKQNNPKETLSVLFIGMDGNSRQNSLRFMPKTRNFILNEMNAIELYRFNKVGINTFPNLIPLLTGFHVDEIRDRGWSPDRFMNKVDHLFAWHAYKQAGYRTAFMLDDKIDTGFHYAKKSWHSSPFDYYNRPMVVIKNASDCVGDTPEISFLMDYWVQLATTFNNTKSKPYFVFSFSKRITHDDFNGAEAADQLYTDFFKKLKDLNVLNNTVVIFFSDHGPRFGPIRQTRAGQIESRTPMFFFMFPLWFHTKYPSLISALRTNQHRLTTHFDVHATLKDLLYFKGETGKGNLSTRGISLFKEISSERLCRHAGIPETFCMCSQQVEAKIIPDLLKEMKNKILKYIVDKTSKHRDKCEVFTFVKIKTALTVKTEDKCSDCSHYQITIAVNPGGRVFESLVEHSNKTGKIKVLSDPDLLTMYRNTADCVKDSVLKYFCYCKNAPRYGDV